MKDENVMPAGSMPPEKQEGKATESKPGTGDGDGGGDKKILGKFKDAEEMESAYSHLEQTLGRQRQEIGDLRATVEDLSSANQPEVEEVDYAAQRGEIEAKIEDGEMSVSEGLRALADIAKQETELNMEAKFGEFERKRNINEAYDRFLTENPDFSSYEESGEIAEEMRKDPMHDKFSAFFAVKARADAANAFEKGKEEALKLASGADGTRSVLSKPGTHARDVVQPKRGMPENERVNGMLGALAAARK